MAGDILDQARSYLKQLPADSPEWQSAVTDFLKDVNGIADAKSAEREAGALLKVTETELLAPVGQHSDRTTQNRNSEKLNADSLAALAALRRAAIKARRQSIEATGSVATWRDGRIVYDTEV